MSFIDKKLFKAILLTSLVLFLASNVWAAAYNVGDDITVEETGGAWKVNGNWAFCLDVELDVEELSTITHVGNSYWDYTSGAFAWDVLDAETKWLVSEFVFGNQYGWSAQHVKQAVWYLEEQYGSESKWTKLYNAALVLGFGGDFDTEFAKQVKALSLVETGTDNEVQGFAVVVPEPGTILLFGLGLLGLAGVSRRKQS